MRAGRAGLGPVVLQRLAGRATNTFSLVPEGWSNLPQGTSDTVSTAGHPFGGSFGIGAIAYPASDNGGTFVWSADFFQPAAGVPEGIRQTVAGLIVGQEYEITFEFTNLGLYTPQGEIATSAFGGQNYASNGNWVITGNNALLGSTPIVAFSQSAGGQVWQDFSLTFTAAQPIIEFAFIANWTSGGTHVGMGIDGIGIAQVRRRARWRCWASRRRWRVVAAGECEEPTCVKQQEREGEPSRSYFLRGIAGCKNTDSSPSLQRLLSVIARALGLAAGSGQSCLSLDRSLSRSISLLPRAETWAKDTLPPRFRQAKNACALGIFPCGSLFSCFVWYENP